MQHEFEQAPTASPRFVEALYWRAVVAATAADAERDLRTIIVDYPLSPWSVEALMRLAQLEMTRRDMDQALAHLNRVLVEHPNSPQRPRASFWIARVKFEQGQLADACRQLGDAARTAPASQVELKQPDRVLVESLRRRRHRDGRGHARRGHGQAAPPRPRPKTAAAAKAPAPPASAAPAKRQYTVQVGAYNTRSGAEALAEVTPREGLRFARLRRDRPLPRAHWALRHAFRGGEGRRQAQRQEDHRLRDGSRAAVSRENATPLMQQYREIKARHQDALLFFRMGDFYEMFYDDAETLSRTLGLTLTARNNGGAAEVPLAGVPAKAIGEYLRRLVGHGFRVAICEQVEDPKVAKGIVRREVVETVTPGAVFADDMLDGARNNFLCALHTIDGAVGIAAADLSTGELRLVRCAPEDVEAALARLAPSEVLVSKQGDAPASAPGRGAENALVTARDAWEFDPALASDELARQFAVASLEGFGIGAADAPAVGAAGALLRYLRELQPGGAAASRASRHRAARPGDAARRDDAA